MGLTNTAAAQAPECSGKNATVSKSIKKPMSAAFDAVKAQNWTEVRPRWLPPRRMTSPSRFTTSSGSTSSRQRQRRRKKYAEAGSELEKITDSPCMSDADRLDNLELLTQVYYQVDQYDKVIQYGNRALQAGAPPDFCLYVGQAYYLTKDYQNAAKVMKEVTTKLEAEGKPPGEQNVRIIHGACSQLDDAACVQEQGEKLVKYYRSPSTGRTWWSR